MMIDDMHSGAMDLMIDIVADIESNGNSRAIGDNGKAFGILQIHQGALTDYNKWNETDHKLEDLLGDERLARLIFKDYMAHYATEKRLCRPVTFEDMARIWNGGPNGYKKKATLGYLEKFKKLAKLRNLYV